MQVVLGIDTANNVASAFMNDAVCRNLLDMSDCQVVMVKESLTFDYDIPFSLPVRCKWDLWMHSMDWGADIKSTTATTQY